ncbi:Nod factor export ATP-binding protein I [Striga asiatica]|uniref:Nod factor export ATP-binding protein I n=1 Tax=Striga asiatica TaxID=4170 RepID=A0A5A7PEK3_STRAF|nr:Nod factor export ATP-binding protein I [Striga asiatica]
MLHPGRISIAELTTIHRSNSTTVRGPDQQQSVARTEPSADRTEPSADRTEPSADRTESSAGTEQVHPPPRVEPTTIRGPNTDFTSHTARSDLPTIAGPNSRMA